MKLVYLIAEVQGCSIERDPGGLVFDASGLTLLVPDKADLERDQVASAWVRARGEVVRLGAFWRPPALPASGLRVYGNAVFGEVLSQQLPLQLVSPADNLLLGVPVELLGREVEEHFLAEVPSEERFPLFCKSQVPKLIPSRVYASRAELLRASAGLSGADSLQVAQPVDIDWEIRAFVCRGEVCAWAMYEGEGQVEFSALSAFVRQVGCAVALPEAVVVDLAGIDGRIALLEFNAAWGAGLNGCDPAGALLAISAATTDSE